MTALPADLPYAVEIRNPRWMDAAWFDLLREHGTAPVLLQGYWMDDVGATLERFGGRIADRACLRLHGEDREGMEERTGADWSRVVRPKDDELSRLAPAIATLVEAVDEVFLNVNNHYEGSAPVTIRKLKGLLSRG